MEELEIIIKSLTRIRYYKVQALADPDFFFAIQSTLHSKNITVPPVGPRDIYYIEPYVTEKRLNIGT